MDNGTRSLIEEFFTPIEPVPEMGIHFSGYLREQFREPSVLPVCFHFRIGSDIGFRIENETLLKWLQQGKLVEEEPVMLIHIAPRPGEPLICSFRAVYDWIQDYPEEWRRAHHKRGWTSFDLNEFQTVDEARQSFLAAMQAEAKQARYRRQQRTLHVPLRRIEMPEQIGRLGSFEVPISVGSTLDWWTLWNLWRTVLSLPQQHRWNVGLDLKYQPWLSQILTTPSRRAIKRGLKELRKFTMALQSYEQSEQSWFPMPGFTYGELTNWRVFFQLHPNEAIGMLQRFFDDPNSWQPDRQRAALLLASTLANANLSVSGNAHDVIRKVEGLYGTLTPRSNYEDYLMTRQYFFVRAESEGTNSDIERFLKFFTLHREPNDGGTDFELRLHRRYYQDSSDTSFAQAMLRKIKSPKPRDQKTMPLSIAMYERIPNLHQSL